MRHAAGIVALAGLATACIALSVSLGGCVDRVEIQQRAETTVPMGPLRVSASNSRYFTTPTGRVVYLTGSHTWNNLQDGGVVGSPLSGVFDYDAYLDFL